LRIENPATPGLHRNIPRHRIARRRVKDFVPIRPVENSNAEGILFLMVLNIARFFASSLAGDLGDCV
jgi:hypothetical protein